MPEPSPPIKARTPLYPLWQIIGTGLYSGYSPIASGTAGSAVALALYCIPGMEKPLLLGILTLVTLAIGVPASGEMEKIHGDDPGIVVIDEIAGMWISLLLLPKSIWVALLAFFLFRLYDIIKPPPARQVEHISGGLGIMLDDVVAGIYANACVRIVIWIFPRII